MAYTICSLTNVLSTYLSALNDSVDHSIVLYLHDKKGELLDVFSQSMKPSDIVEKILKLTKKPESEI